MRSHKQGTYGVLGLAAALLLGLFVIGRLIVAAAEIERDPVATGSAQRPCRSPREKPVTVDPEAAPPSAEAPGTGGGRLAAVLDWLRSRANNSLSRLALLWFRRYLEASRNSGAALTAYFTLSALPTALVIVAFFNLADGNDNAFAERVISHMKLNGTTASLVHDLFGSTSNNLLAATLTIVIGFLLWGLAIGQLYQDLYARVWRIHVGGVADQLRFTIWFFVTSGLVALMTVSTANLRSDGWLVLIPVWIVGSTIFWLWTPASCFTAWSRCARSSRGAPRRSRPGRHGRHLAAVDRTHDQPERQGLRLVRSRPRALRLHLHRDHHLDVLRRLLARLGRMAANRAKSGKELP